MQSRNASEGEKYSMEGSNWEERRSVAEKEIQHITFALSGGGTKSKSCKRKESPNESGKLLEYEGVGKVKSPLWLWQRKASLLSWGLPN